MSLESWFDTAPSHAARKAGHWEVVKLLEEAMSGWSMVNQSHKILQELQMLSSVTPNRHTKYDCHKLTFAKIVSWPGFLASGKSSVFLTLFKSLCCIILEAFWQYKF